MTPELLDQALEAAVAKHFATLFEVMLVEKDTEIAMQRFKGGLTRLAERERIVRDVIRKM